VLPLSIPLPTGEPDNRSSVRAAVSKPMVVAMSPQLVKSVDDIPTVCLESDLATIFRLPMTQVRFWRRFPEYLPFPPLPWFDRQIRVSGCVVAWFLAQEATTFDQTFYSPLRELADANRRRRIPWWRFTSPHDRRFWAVPLENEQPAISVEDVAHSLRATASSVRRIARDPEFPMPPATTHPLRWTAGQLERLLWAPQDHEEHLRRRKGP
jgi:hypothetical protein